MPELGEAKRRDAPMISDALLAALLAGAKPAGDSAPQLRPLAEALADLTARPGGDELDGEAETLAAFRDQFATPGPVRQPRQVEQPRQPHQRRRAHQPRRRRPRFLPRSLPVRAAAAVRAVVLGLGGLATAAYAGALPAPVQQLAHEIIDAPAPPAQPATRPSPAAPAASYPSPAPSGRTHPTTASHGHGKPGSHPTPNGKGKGQGKGKGNGQGQGHGHGKPTSHPTPNGNGNGNGNGSGNGNGTGNGHGHGKPASNRGQGKTASNSGHGKS